MRRVLKFIFCMFFCLLFYTDVFALTLSLREDRLSINADRVPLQVILKELSEHGIEVQIDPVINPIVSAHFADRDLQWGIGTIIKPLNYVLIWKAVDGPVGRITRLSEIRIFEPGRKRMMKSLTKADSLSVVKDPHTGILYVKDEVLLTLKKGMTLEGFKKLLHQIKGTVIGSYPKLGIYRIRLPENSDAPAIVKQLKENDAVAETEPNYIYPITEPTKNDRTLQPVPDLADSPGNQGLVSIAILDTGWDKAYDQVVSVKTSLDAFDPEQPIRDPLGHGTQMAMLAAGTVKPYGVEMDQHYDNPVIPIRIFDANGNTSSFLVMKSIDFALEKGARIISLSWGSETKSDFLEYQLNLAVSKGAIVLAAAGNQPTGKPVYPASYDAVIGVGALGLDGKSWAQSNYGDAVSLYAPGYASFPVGYRGGPGSYAGTSISTAFTASLFAEYLSKHPGATGQEIFSVLNRK